MAIAETLYWDSKTQRAFNTHELASERSESACVHRNADNEMCGEPAFCQALCFAGIFPACERHGKLGETLNVEPDNTRQDDFRIAGTVSFAASGGSWFRTAISPRSPCVRFAAICHKCGTHLPKDMTIQITKTTGKRLCSRCFVAREDRKLKRKAGRMACQVPAQ